LKFFFYTVSRGKSIIEKVDKKIIVNQAVVEISKSWILKKLKSQKAETAKS